MLWVRIPEKVYFKYGCLPVALGDLEGRKRAFIVTDKFLYSTGILADLLHKLDSMGIGDRGVRGCRARPDHSAGPQGA